MKIAIIDDKKNQYDILHSVCKEYGENNKIRIDIDYYQDGNIFLCNLDNKNYHICFIDIYMSAINGIDLAKKLREINKDIVIVFVTTSSDFMADAFSVHSFHYITKPYAKEKIFQVLTDSIAILPDISHYIDVIYDKKNVRIKIKDLVSCESEGHYLILTTSDNKELKVRMTLKEFIEKTKAYAELIQINRGIIINIDYLDKIDNSNCHLTSGTVFPIKVREKKNIENRINNYIFNKLRRISNI